MADTSLKGRLRNLFSTNVVVRQVGGDRGLKVADTDHVQAFSINGRDRYSRIFSPMSGYGQMAGIGQQAMAYQSQRLELFRDYDMMDNDPLISSALDIYADECVGPDTIIPLLNGKKYSIKELYDLKLMNFWVYSLDETGNFAPAKCERVAYNGQKEMFKITLDDGSIIKASSNHQWVLSDNSLANTCELVKGTSITAFQTKISDFKTMFGYEMLKIDGKWKFTHRLVANYILKLKSEKEYDVTNIKTLRNKIKLSTTKINVLGIREYVNQIESSGKNPARNLNPLLEKSGLTYNQLTTILRESGYKNYSDFVTSNNHRVVKIESVGKEDAYDLVNSGNSHIYAIESIDGSKIFCHNCTVKNEFGEILTINCDDGEMKDVLHNLFYDILNIEFNLYPWIRNLCKYGDFFLYLEISEKYGIHNVMPMSVYETMRIEGEDPKNPYLVKFRTTGQTMPKAEFENFEIAHFRLLSDSNFLPYGKCLDGDSRIWTPTGQVFLKNINVGDLIYSFDTKSNKLIPATVVDWLKTGKKEVFELRTANQKILATAEHPFLLSTGEYKPLSQLTVNDEIVVPNKDIGSSEKISALLKNNTQILNNLSQFIRFFGFMLGDGWVENNSVSFSLGNRLDKSSQYLEIISLLGYNPNILFEGTTRAYCKIYSSKFMKILETCGFITGTLNKIVPEWVYELPPDLLKEFLHGFIDADGCEIKNGFQVCGINKKLIYDMHHVAQLIGLTVNNPYETPTGKNTWGGYSKPCFTFGIRNTNKNSKKLSETVRTQRIWNIESKGIREVFDIEVDSAEHNFVASGMVVHNSMVEAGRRVWKQLTLMEDAMMIHRIMRAPEKRVFKVDIGNIAPAEVDAFMEKTITKMKKAPLVDPRTGDFNLRYNIQNMTEDFYLPVRGSESGMSIDSLKGLEFNGIEDIDYIKSKVFAALKIPKAFLGFDENLSGKLTLAAEDVRFSRTIERVQRIVVSELTKIAVVHLYAQGFTDERLVDFDLQLTNPSTIAEQEKISLWKEKVDLAKSVQEMKLIGSEWIYDNIFEMPKEEQIKQRIQIVDDVKRAFRYTSIETQGQDPAKAEPAHPANAGIGPGAPEEESGNPVGRPEEGMNYDQDSHARGRDPLGHQENRGAMKAFPQRASPKRTGFVKESYGLDQMKRSIDFKSQDEPKFLKEEVLLDISDTEEN